jgi:hypothetical protein
MMMPGRKFSNTSAYRYGFNGQEKDKEINPEGNITTAEYWEYDSRIGRRWNVDPKPIEEISPYSTFSNSPMLFNDVHGDTARIKWGLFGKNNISYVGGKWIDTKTREEYKIDKNTPNRVKTQIEDYNTLHTISGFEEMLNTIDNVQRSVFLRTDEGVTDLGKIREAELNGEKNTASIEIQVGSIKSNFERSLQMDGKAASIPSYVVLGHELGHVYDYLFNLSRFNNGWRNFYVLYETQDPDAAGEKRISASEINAMYYENLARVHANISPRSYYSTNRGTPEEAGKAQISEGNFELIKVGKLPGRVYRWITFSNLNGESTELLVPYNKTHVATKKR